MRIITQGLSDSQQVEAVTKAAHVDELRARSMLAGGPWDAIILAESVVIAPSIYDMVADRSAPSEAVGELVALKAHAEYGEVRTLGESGGTILVTASGRDTALVPH